MIQLIIVDYLLINILGRGLALRTEGSKVRIVDSNPNSLSELYEQVVLTKNIYRKFMIKY